MFLPLIRIQCGIFNFIVFEQQKQRTLKNKLLIYLLALFVPIKTINSKAAGDNVSKNSKATELDYMKALVNLQLPITLV
jgi:Na+-transporting NADH:ubiquinone oxidoreductase subunit NqrE